MYFSLRVKSNGTIVLLLCATLLCVNNLIDSIVGSVWHANDFINLHWQSATAKEVPSPQNYINI